LKFVLVGREAVYRMKDNELTVVVAWYATTEASRSRIRNASFPFILLLSYNYEDVAMDQIYLEKGV
jgi:hypothetical protein